MTNFDEHIALEPTGEGVFAGAVFDGWATPRGPLGGYVMAFLLRAFDLVIDEPERSARSVTMHFMRPPEVGPIEVHATVERAGRSLSTVTGRLLQHGKLIGLGVGAYSKPWAGPLIADEMKMPEVEPPGERVAMGHGPGRETPPAFTQRITMQPRVGSAPFSGSDHARIGGWIGLLEERPLDAAALAVMADAWFPAPWPRLSSLAPAPTIDLTLHFRAPLPQPDSLVLGDFRSRHVRDGFFDEEGELWAPDGTLLVQSRQLALLLGAELHPDQVENAAG